MIIEYLGHSAFKVSGEFSVVFDPFKNIGYDMKKVDCDYVLCSHNHFDHYATELVNCKDIIPNHLLKRVNSFHDSQGGQLRGKNVINIVDFGGIKVCHMGDIGETINDDYINRIGRIDVLLIPVGGNYTINYVEAYEYINRLKPKIAIPMHYKGKSILDIDTSENFLHLVQDYVYVGKKFNVEDYLSENTRIIYMGE